MTTSYVYLPKTLKFDNVGINWYDDSKLTSKREDGQVMRERKAIKLLIDKIKELTWCNGIVNWRITEDFNKHGIKGYLIQGLKMKIEDDMMISSDLNGELLKDTSRVLNMILVDSVLKIELCDKNAKIFLKDGSITIHGL